MNQSTAARASSYFKSDYGEDVKWRKKFVFNVILFFFRFGKAWRASGERGQGEGESEDGEKRLYCVYVLRDFVVIWIYQALVVFLLFFDRMLMVKGREGKKENFNGAAERREQAKGKSIP